MAGADALLLIVAVLGDNELRSLLAETRRYGMEALVEVHDEAEVERALAAGAQVIGVNNRDLRTFDVDLATTERLRPLIPADRVLVSESGIHGPDDVRRLAAMGVDAMLVGESLVTARPEDRQGKVRELVRGQGKYCLTITDNGQRASIGRDPVIRNRCPPQIPANSEKTVRRSASESL